MTDARFPERWLNDRRLLRLSDAGFRLHVVALAWSVSNRTDGVLYDDDLMLMVNVDPARAIELVKAAVWLRDADRYVIAEFDSTQTPAAQLDALDRRRRSDRDRARRYRERKALSLDSSRDDKGQARTGQAVTQDLEEERSEEEVQARDERANGDAWGAA
jgi:hypothetical protein